MRISKVFLVMVGLISLLFINQVMAADFPNKPITLINPWASGGGSDIIMRVLAKATSKYLAQPVVIENKPGGGGTVGPAGMAATAKPDGYTLSQIPIGIFRMPYIIKASWDPLRDFSYIIQIAGYGVGVAVKSDAPWKTWDEFIKYSKENPGKISYASTGAGTTPHVTMELIALRNGIKWIHVPMKGGAEGVPAVLGGHVTATADSMGSWAPQVDAGAIRPLVTWGNQRAKRYPTVPTLKELGYGIVANSPLGIAGPKGMDPKIIEILHDAFKKGMDEPEFKEMLDKLDMEPFYLNSKDYEKYAKDLSREAGEIVEKLGLKNK